MNREQMNAAKRDMTEWLSHPKELGKAPGRIECTGEFDLHGLHYYIFKYRKGLLGKWMLGVCGGYEGDAMEHCGHVFSQMEEYREADAVEKATAMVEMIRSYWMEQAKKAEEKKKNTGSFVGFVLLSEVGWDKEQLVRDLKEKWEIDAVEDSGEDEEDGQGEDEEDGQRDDSLIFSSDGMMIAVSLMPGPVPDHEAEENAKNNYLWPEAVEAARGHKAHLMVAVLGRDADLLERGKMFVKVTACCCKQENAAGVFASGTVFEPRFYEAFADMMKKDELPIFNWIWFGLYRREGGVCCYTYGMNLFGKDEMEVLDADGQPSEVREFMTNMAAYVLEYNVTLNDGETIGFSAEDKHAITRSSGVSLPGMTLKIQYNQQG